MNQLVPVYATISPEDATELRLIAERVRLRLKRTAEDVVAVGQELLAAKEKLPHGQFGAWLEAEFEMSERNAQNFMAVAERFGGKSAKFADLPISALYLLAAPSTPDTVVAAVERREVEPTHAAIKRAVEEARADERARAGDMMRNLNIQLGQSRDEVARLKGARTFEQPKRQEEQPRPPLPAPPDASVRLAAEAWSWLQQWHARYSPYRHLDAFAGVAPFFDAIEDMSQDSR